MAERRATPILLVTGFLGSGKTTLLARWLREPVLAGAMAIVNEFGEVGIDDRLIQGASSAAVLLENGCACCTAGEDLAEVLERLFWAQLSREIAPIPWVLIETTGVAEPAPILKLISDVPLLAERYHVAGVVTVVDARRGPAQAEAHIECRLQLAEADVVALTKTDIATAAELGAAERLAESLAPGARLMRSAHASLSVDEVLAAIAGFGSLRERPGHIHPHAHLDSLDSYFLDLPGTIDCAALELACRTAFGQFRDELLRLKGLGRFHGGPALSVFQVEADGGLEVSPIAASAGDERPGLTIITRNRPARDVAAFISEAAARAGARKIEASMQN